MLVDWHLFFTVFGIIFLAELPDKTALATLLLATRSDSRAVFVGVASAFLVQTLVAAIFGKFISLLPGRYVHIGAGLMFLGFAVHMWRSRTEADEEIKTRGNVALGFWKACWAAFTVIFIAEWGDLTQIATASLIARYQQNQITVFIAALLALWVVTGLAIFAGQRIHRVVKPALLKSACILLFAAVGIYFLVDGFKGS